MHDIRDSGPPALAIQNRNCVEKLRTRIFAQKCSGKMVDVTRSRLRIRLSRLVSRGTRSRKLWRRHFTHRIRAVADCSSETSANLRGTQVSHSEVVRGFARDGPIKINAIAFAHRPKISD